ncbi:ACT domain-containing protein (plasmid) [Coraliomargarita sp. W4R53]
MAITDLDELVRSMQPTRRDGEFVFVGVAVPADVVVEASVHEDEGHSAVISRADADRLGLHYDFVAVWITLRVHSALDAVGLTAVVSTALTDAGVSCNVIAGLRHDHLLVPAESADTALDALRQLTAAKNP